MAEPRRWSLRRSVIAVHRDIGYLAAGLTVVYAVSGVAVNHVADWNPSYSIERETRALPKSDAPEVAQVVAALQLPGPPKSTFRPAPGRLRLFYDGLTVEADGAAGTVAIERTTERPLLRQVNFLHLNHPKKFWTLIADVYAVALAALALTGIFILKGRKGLAGRGKWLVGLGVAIPVVALWMLR